MKRIAAYQAGSVPGDKAANLERVRRAAGAAAQLGADVLVLPELFLTGYNIGALAQTLAEPRDGPSLVALSEIAKQSGCGLAVGFSERDRDGVYNSAVLIDRAGTQCAVYRKIHLFGDVEAALFQRGDKHCVAGMAGSKIGLAICYDIEFPEFCRALKRAGAGIVLTPTANMTPYWQIPTTLIRARALENSMTIAYVNHCGTENGMRFTGLSCITGPDGIDLARAGSTSEVLLVAELPAPGALGPLSTQVADL
jgi:5-aminopentanamidase